MNSRIRTYEAAYDADMDLVHANLSWLNTLMQKKGVSLWGVADLSDFSTPPDETGQSFPVGISLAVPVNPVIMSGLKNGPSGEYWDEYRRINERLDQICMSIADAVKSKGYQARPLAASQRTDKAGIRGDFPHKTAATRAGIGWIGKSCQLIIAFVIAVL